MVSEGLIKGLENREKDGNPIKMAVVGTGFIGRGLINQVELMKGIRTVAVANRTISKGIKVVNQTKKNNGYKVCKNLKEINETIKNSCR